MPALSISHAPAGGTAMPRDSLRGDESGNRLGSGVTKGERNYLVTVLDAARFGCAAAALAYLMRSIDVGFESLRPWASAGLIAGAITFAMSRIELEGPKPSPRSWRWAVPYGFSVVLIAAFIWPETTRKDQDLGLVQVAMLIGVAIRFGWDWLRSWLRRDQ